MRSSKIYHTVIAISLAILFMSGSLASACGISTHQEIMQRTILLFDPATEPDLVQLMSDNAGAAQAGAVFPDAFWLLRVLAGNDDYYQQMGVMVHAGYGSLFGEKTMEYLGLIDGPPYNEYDQLVVAYCFGSFCHSAADAAFHPGFLPPAFDNDGVTEDLVEVGLDVFCMMEQGELTNPIEWSVPCSFMASIVRSCGYRLNSLEVLIGTLGLRIGIELEKSLSPSAYLLALALMPWTHENYVSYPDGGLDNCAGDASTVLRSAWQELAGQELWAASQALNSTICSDEQSNPMIRLSAWGLQLFAAGIVDVPITFEESGMVKIGVPMIVDEARFAEQLAALPYQW